MDVREEGTSVDPLPSSKINILLMGARANIIGLTLRKPKKDLVAIEDRDRNYDLFPNLTTFACKGYIYHLIDPSPFFASDLNARNILTVADPVLTDALFLSNTIILVLSANAVDAAKNQNSVEKFVDCAHHFRHFIHFIVLVSRMDSSITENDPNWDEARFNDVRTAAITAAPLLNQLTSTWIPVDVSNEKEENIHTRSGKCPWFQGDILAECLRQLTEQRLQQQDDVPPNLPCKFSIYVPEGVEGFPNIFKVVGQQISGTMVKNQTYKLLPNNVPVKVVNMNSAGNSIERAETGEILVLLLYTENPQLVIRDGGAICSTDVTHHFNKRIKAMINLVDNFDVFDWPINIQLNGFQTQAYILDLKLEDGTEISTPGAGSEVRATIAFKGFHLEGINTGLFVIKTGRFQKLVKGIGRITRIDQPWDPKTQQALRLWEHNFLHRSRDFRELFTLAPITNTGHWQNIS